LALSALGQSEPPAAAVYSGAQEWTVAVAAFGAEGLPADQRIIADLICRRLRMDIQAVPSRLRSAAEIAADSGRETLAAQAVAAKDYAAKRSALDALFFKGLPDWQYRRDAAAARTALDKSSAAYQAALGRRSEVRGEVAVKLYADNAKDIYPAAPADADKARFCRERNVDAVVTGTAELFYDRILVAVTVYEAAEGRNSYYDETIFSPENRDAALTELSGRLVKRIAGRPTGRLAIAVLPPEADIVLNGALAGHGTVGPIEMPVGDFELAGEADGYKTSAVAGRIAADAELRLSVELEPAPLSRLAVGVFDADGQAIDPETVVLRLGGEYAGTALTPLDLPAGGSFYLTAESADGRKAALAAPVPEGGAAIGLTLVRPSGRTDGVETARKTFYNSFARFSIALPIAFLASGVAQSYATALTVNSGNARLRAAADWSQNIATLGILTTISFFSESMYQLYFYVLSTAEGGVPYRPGLAGAVAEE
jgi:hypothetical protein